MSESAHFEEILRACEDEVADIALLRPGLAWGPIAPATRWHGSEEEAVEAIIDSISRRVGVECLIGVADGTLATLLAARTGQIVPSGGSPAYLEHLVLERIPYLLPGYGQTLNALIATLKKLGIKRAHDVLQIDQKALCARFGHPMETLLTLIRGEDIELSCGKRLCTELTFSLPIEPPAQEIEHAMIPMTRIAHDVAATLALRGLNAHSLRITLHTEAGQTRTRVWDGCNARDVGAVIERLRWHAQGWMTLNDLSHDEAPCAPLSAIEVIVSDFTTATEGEYLWGKDAHKDAVDRAVAHIQALLGEEGALAVGIQGGYDPRTRTHFRPWGSSCEGKIARTGEWEGGVTQNPDTLCHPPIPITLWATQQQECGKRKMRIIASEAQSPHLRTGKSDPHTEDGQEAFAKERQIVFVTQRGTLSADPTQLALQSTPRSRVLLHWEKGRLYTVRATSPLWVIRGRWWQPQDKNYSQRAYLRVAVEQGPDLLVKYQKGQWWIEGVYA